MKVLISILLLLILSVNSVFSQKHLKINVQEHTNYLGIEFKKHEKKYSDSLSVINILNKLRNELYNKGFLTASIDTISKLNDTINVNIHLGKQYKWGRINFDLVDNDVLNRLNILPNNYNDKIIDLQAFNIYLERIISYYESVGFPFVSVGLKNVDFNDSIISANLYLEKSQKYYIKNIILKGNSKIKLPYLYNKLGIYPKSVYNNKNIDLIHKKINNLSFVGQIKPLELEYSDSTLDLFLYLKNEKANSFNGVLGFMPASDENNKLKISGDVNFSIWNAWGRGEHLLFNWKRPSDLTQKLNLHFSFPYLFYTKIGVETNFELYKQDTSFLNIISDVGLRFDFAQDQYFKTFVEYNSSNTISDIISESNQIKASADVSKVLYGLEYSYTNLDYIINPSSGLNLNLFGAFGKKKILKAQNIDSLFDNTAKTIQLKAGLNLKYYIPVYKNFVFLISTDLRFMSSLDNKLGNNLLFENELFRFGGAKSLRGFDEDAFFASFFVLNNLELRYRFERYSAFYIFVNGAYYNKHTINNNTSDYPFGFGLGVDIEMRTGIFSLAYALGKQFDNPFQIKSAKIHFGYITRF